MTPREATSNLITNFKQHPFRTGIAFSWFCLKKLAMFWMRAFVVSGVFALLALYFFPGVAGDAPDLYFLLDIEKVRNFCLLLGFTVELARVSFHAANRLIFGPKMKVKPATPWIFRNVPQD